MDSYDPRLHPSHSTALPLDNRNLDYRDRRPPAPRSRYDGLGHYDRAPAREYRDHHRAAQPEYEHDHGRGRPFQPHSGSGREHHHRLDDHRDWAQADYSWDGHGHDARAYTNDRYHSTGWGHERERERERDGDSHHVDQSRRPQEEYRRDRHRHQEPSDHRRLPAEYHSNHRDSSHDRRPAVHPEQAAVVPSTHLADPPPPPSLQSLTATQPNSLPSSTSAAATPSIPPPLPSELHALAEQGPMLHQAERAATQALSRQLPPSLMLDLLQDVDEILDLLLPAVLQTEQAGDVDVDKVVATLEARVKSQLKMARFTAKHLKTLRDHPMLSLVLDPVIDSEVRRVAEGFNNG